MSHHTVSVELEDKPGALARVSQMFARRGYNIMSLAVGPTERRGVSRLTLRVDCSENSFEQIEKQMHKLVNVLRVTELPPDESVERELALITVTAPADKRSSFARMACASSSVRGGSACAGRGARRVKRGRRPRPFTKERTSWQK